MTKSYQGNEVVEYKQTPGKKYCLNPAFARHLPDGTGKKVIDVGCGDGFYSQMCAAKGFDYTGIDLSPDMIQKAKNNFPQHNFKVASCLELSSHFDANSFDIAISSMLFPEFDNIQDFKETLKEIAYVLKPSATLLIGTAHPAFDMFMRKHLLGQPNVETEFTNYYDSGKVFEVKSINMDVTFEDHHWTFSDYINTIINAGFSLDLTDECQVISPNDLDPNSYQQKLQLPSYILFKAIKH